MDTLAAIAARRSVRRFRPDAVEPRLVTACLEAARQAPSATNSQPWKFVVVRDAARRRALAEAACGQHFVGEAPVVIALLGDRRSFRKRLRRGKELVDIGAVDAETADRLAAAYQNRDRQEDPTPAITLNCMLAGQNLVLAAAGLGLGSCWVMAMDREKVSSVLALPESLFPVALIPLGYAARETPPRPRYALPEIVCDEEIDRPWVDDSAGG